ncbi:conserved hypothetical protein [Flavobacterium psychrophilum]|nr:conserved hypothetical protein [Flavobacterium psychrophilum]
MYCVAFWLVSINKQLPDDKEEPVFIFTCDGLIIEMQNDKISNLAISNTKWKLNTISVGMSLV